jgi:hypothetical protein
MPPTMGSIEDAAELKAVAEDFGLRVHELRANPATSRFIIALDHGVDSDRVYVHASPTKMTISLDLSDGASESLSFDGALEKLLDAIGK